MKTIQELQDAIESGGVTVFFGQSVAKGRPGQWFVNTGTGSRQVYADTLADALTELLVPEEDDLL